jgi:hypothetical protein
MWTSSLFTSRSRSLAAVLWDAADVGPAHAIAAMVRCSKLGGKPLTMWTPGWTTLQKPVRFKRYAWSFDSPKDVA